MTWLQLHIAACAEDADAIETAMLHSGAQSVTMTDEEDRPILEPGVGETPLWNKVRVTGLYGADTNQQAVSDLILSGCEIVPQALHWELLEDQLWERAWMAHFEPIRCGERLWICPSWREPPDKNAVNLLLDPGLAFGTGTHPTTYLCLNWLDGLDLEGKTVIDYGCGSGILGIAALLLGAERVLAIDNDPQALIATRENLLRNHLPEERLHAFLPEEAPELKADITIANILAEPLITLASNIGCATVCGGSLCLSGIMEHQVQQVIAAYPGFEFLPTASKDEWVRLNATKVV